MNVIVNEHKLQELAGEAVFRRGEDYWRHGMVKDFEFKNGILSGRVQGSEVHPYKVKIYFRNKNTVHPECTCPYDWGMFCKHSVALLLQWSQENRIQGQEENLRRGVADVAILRDEFTESKDDRAQDNDDPREKRFPWQKKITLQLFP